MSSTTQQVLNGVNVTQLVETVGAIQAQPELAKFQFRASNVWQGGTHTRSSFQGFWGAGQEDASREAPLALESDEPAVLLGGSRAPNAVEAVLHALAACLTVGFVANAAAQGIEVRSFETELEGELDVHGFLALDPAVRPGYEGIRVTYRVDCDATPEQVDELCAHVQRTSPVMDIVTNPVRVTIARA